MKIYTASEYLGAFTNKVPICYFIKNTDNVTISKIEYHLNDNLYQSLTTDLNKSSVRNILLDKNSLADNSNNTLVIKAYNGNTVLASATVYFSFVINEAQEEADNINFIENFNKHGVPSEKYAAYQASQIRYDETSTVADQIVNLKKQIDTLSNGEVSFEDERIESLFQLSSKNKSEIDAIKSDIAHIQSSGSGEVTKGKDGEDGFSPVVAVTDENGQHTVKITDKSGEKTFVVKDGKDGVGDKGDKGDNGNDGFSPTVTITEGSGQHTITITDKNGSNSFVVKDGANGKDGKDGKDGQNTSSGNGEVASFNGRKGAVMPQKGDYNIEMITVLDDEGNPITNEDGSLASFIDYLSNFVSDTSLRQHYQKQIMTTEGNVTLKPNQFYLWNVDVASLTIGLESPTDANIMAEYHFMFNSGETATTLSLPTNVKIPSDFNIEANKVYEISILEGCLTYQSWGK